MAGRVLFLPYTAYTLVFIALAFADSYARFVFCEIFAVFSLLFFEHFCGFCHFADSFWADRFMPHCVDCDLFAFKFEIRSKTALRNLRQLNKRLLLLFYFKNFKLTKERHSPVEAP